MNNSYISLMLSQPPGLRTLLIILPSDIIDYLSFILVFPAKEKVLLNCETFLLGRSGVV